MISKIRIFGFKSGVGYQSDKRDEKQYERYHFRSEKASGKKKENSPESFEAVLQKSLNKRR